MITKLISKRNSSPIFSGENKRSLIVTLTSELVDMGLDKEEVNEDCISISLIEENNKRKIVIEKNDN